MILFRAVVGSAALMVSVVADCPPSSGGTASLREEDGSLGGGSLEGGLGSGGLVDTGSASASALVADCFFDKNSATLPAT